MVRKHCELREIRKHLNMSQSQFAKYFHINIATLQMWEQGINRESPAVLWLVKRVIELEGRPYSITEVPADVAEDEEK